MGIYSIIDNRAWNSLKIVTEEFNNFSPIKTRENNHIDLDSERYGILKMYTSYKVINKWMGRVYHFRWNCVIHDQRPESNQSIQLVYGGAFGKKEPNFKSSTSRSLVNLLNTDKEVLDICRSIDFEKLEIIYSKKEGVWQIEFWPNYGDFIWILIPPIRYFRKPSLHEVEKTALLIQKINKMIKRGGVD